MSRLALLIALALTGCSRAPAPEARSEDLGGSVRKLCDEGRAIYYVPWKGVAVVPNAPECKQKEKVA